MEGRFVSRIRRPLSFSLAVLAGAVLLPAGAAQAAQDQAAATVVCTGAAEQTYAPPLGPLPRVTDVSVNEELTCIGGPFITGTSSASFNEQASCLIPPLTDTVLPTSVIVYHWANGQTSTVALTVPTVVRAANQTIVTGAGTVTSGYAQGSAVIREVTTIDLDVLGCLTSSLDRRTGTEVFTILL